MNRKQASKIVEELIDVTIEAANYSGDDGIAHGQAFSRREVLRYTIIRGLCEMGTRRKQPCLWTCGGGFGVPVQYGYGYWTGPDRDLLCVIDNVTTASIAEVVLSPISRSKLLAWILFRVKRCFILGRQRGRFVPKT